MVAIRNVVAVLICCSVSVKASCFDQLTIVEDSSRKLGCCEGACHDDDDCRGSLSCFERHEFEAIPGCLGFGRLATNYCYQASFTLSPTPPVAPYTLSPTAPSPPGLCNNEPLQLVSADTHDNDYSGDLQLGCCQGDCDSNEDCLGSLECFQRHGTEHVPGCSQRRRYPGADFCYDPNTNAPPPTTPPPTPPAVGSTQCGRDLTFVGDNSDLDGYLLGCCEGDCDQGQCAPGLVCFYRDGLETVPGCTGHDNFPGADFCIDPMALEPPTPPPTPQMTPPPTPINTPPPTPVPPTPPPTPVPPTPCGGPLEYIGNDSELDGGLLQCCQGDCDGDGQCANGLECLHRDYTEFVPGCAGQGVLSGIDICYDPDSDGTMVCGGDLIYVGNNYDLVNYKLGCCEGDCDVDDDCVGDLICFQRNAKEPVPGCTGRHRYSKSDFCIDPIYLNPPASCGGPLTYIGDDSELDGALLNCCEGDCDSDADCADHLECFQRTATEHVRGCSGHTALSGVDICVDPNANGSTECGGDLVDVGNDDELYGYKLGCCEGDCDHDRDCAGDLRCFFRSYSESVPGCNGSGQSGKDYCYDPSI